MSIKLSVNLNAVALLRNRRNVPWPDLIQLGRIALQAGAAGITVHPRPDERHIRFSDLGALRRLLDEAFPACEFNIEGYPTDHFLELARKNRADQVTLVPDSPEQSTSDHGWNFAENTDFLQTVITSVKKSGMRVSLFADPSPDGLETAYAVGADRVEFYTGPYGAAWNNAEKQCQELEKLARAADYARALGLGINAGHDLTVANLPALVQKLPCLYEVSIGHGLIADALEYGMKASVRRFLEVLA